MKVMKEMREKEWRVEQKSDRKFSKILFDTDNMVRGLLDEKLKSNNGSFSAKEEYSVLNPSKEYHHLIVSVF